MSLPHDQASNLLAARNYDQARRVRVRVALAAISVSIIISLLFVVSYLWNEEYLLLSAVLLPLLLPLTALGYLIWRTGRYRYVLAYVLSFFTIMGLFNLASTPTYLVDVFLIPMMSGIAFLTLHIRHAVLSVLYLLLLYAITALTVYYFEPIPVLYSNDNVGSLVVGFVGATIGSIVIFYYFSRAYRESSESLGNSLIALSKANDDNHLLLQVLSHDFKNYLQRMLMDIDVGERELNDERATARFESLRVSIRNLSGLLGEVQEVRNLVANDDAMVAELSLSLAVKKMELLFRQQLLQKKLRLVFEPGDELVVRVNADVFLHIILANILSNALKFSPLDSDVCIRATRFNDQGEITITNQAGRQHYANLAKIKAGSVKIASSVGTDHESGQGVGSSIVRRFCRLHGIGFSIDTGKENSNDVLTVISRLTVPLA